MKDRIKLIMENENLTPAKFADKLQINRAVVSHILNGRNNPSLDVVMKILHEMNYVNPEWLLNGTLPMYRDGVDVDSIPKEPDLFTQDEKKSPAYSEKAEYLTETAVKQPQKSDQSIDNKIIDSMKTSDKKITQIIIYYNDSTFETFIPQPVKIDLQNQRS